MINPYQSCALCPRKCRVNRIAGEKGFCGQGPNMMLACVTLHKGEEPPLTGKDGSGAFFYSGCTLKCPFCQNFQISRQDAGRDITVSEFAELALLAEERGAVNINLVTATQFIPSLAEGITLARSKGLALPVVWNSSGFEDLEALKIIDPLVDVYLPDCKTLDKQTAERLFSCAEYPYRVKETLLMMARKGNPVFDSCGMLIKGLVMRHLVVPGYLESTREVLSWYAANLKNTALLSLMVQYINPSSPDIANVRESPHPCPTGSITDKDYDSIIDILNELDIEEGFIQEQSGNADWLPDFNRFNPFPEEYSKPVWHWREGLI